MGQLYGDAAGGSYRLGDENRYAVLKGEIQKRYRELMIQVIIFGLKGLFKLSTALPLKSTLIVY